MKKDPAATSLVLSVPVPGQGELLRPTAQEIRASLGLRPMALAEIQNRDGAHTFLAILSDSDDVIARVGQLGPRCGLKVIPRALTQPKTPDTSTGAPFLFAGALAHGSRPGIEKMSEVLAVSGDASEADLSRAIDQALDGPPLFELRCGGCVLKAGGVDRGARPLVMGILNVTPDSFSDGGQFDGPEAAVRRGVEMAEQGADVVDVGGESTRPGSIPVPEEEECRRVLPVIEALAKKIDLPISVDTTKAAVARRAAEAGARMINDISGMTMDREMAAAAAELGVPVVLNHIRGVPRSMQESPAYEHVVLEVLLELAARARAARAAGVAPSCIIVDPGIGFGKRADDNLALLRHLPIFRALRAPILVGVSRKSFLGAVTGRAVGQRGAAGLAAEVMAAAAGADIVRTHEPAATLDALKIAQAISGSPVTH